MTLDDITQANALWSDHKAIINRIAMHDLSTLDFLKARIWHRLHDITSAAKTEQVCLTFIDPCPHLFADQGYVDVRFGVLVRTETGFAAPNLPILLDLSVSTLNNVSISITLQLPEEGSVYRAPFLAALTPLAPVIKDMPADWCTDLELAEVSLKGPKSGHQDAGALPIFDLDKLVDRLIDTLASITRCVIEPLALQLTDDHTAAEALPQHSHPC